MAIVIVGIELGSFQLLFVALHTYILATILSMAIGIILNWIGSRKLVFKHSKYSKAMEFTLIATTSLVGVIIQTSTIFVCVQFFTLIPVVGKFLAIGVTFFWNYFIRAYYIFEKPIIY